MKLEWKEIDGFGGKYLISNTGRVINTNYNKSGQPKEIMANQDVNGYMVVNLTCQNKSNPRFVHRLVMMTFQPIDNVKEMQVDHIDNDRTNNNLSNLRWVSRKYNNGRKHARKMRSQNYYSKRHPDEFIRAEKDGETKYFINQREAADYIGCSKVAITLALSKRVEHIHKAYGWTLTYVPKTECNELAKKIDQDKIEKEMLIINRREEHKKNTEQLRNEMRKEINMEINKLKNELKELKTKAEDAKYQYEGLTREIERVKKQIAALDFNHQKWDLHAVLQYTESGELVKEWKSAHEIQKEMGIDVRPAIKGLKDNHIKGFIWKYKIER